MKKKSFVLLTSMLIIAIALTLYFTYQNKQSENVVVHQVEMNALPKEAQALNTALISEGAKTPTYFTLTNSSNTSIYAVLSRKRVLSTPSKNNEFQDFLHFPNNKNEQVSSTIQNNLLLVIYNKGSDLHERLTFANETSLFNSTSSNTEKNFSSFIPNIQSNTKKGTSLGYSIFTDNEELIKKVKSDPNKIEQLISEDDIVYEYKVTVNETQ
ncbi:hypothetical protein [Enterococcus sp. AZ192]|uniref:hypothetical protein n=1 Tax=unclassified Enterococcus TaxID=2608891 RepID=UPI003D2785F7